MRDRWRQAVRAVDRPPRRRPRPVPALRSLALSVVAIVVWAIVAWPGDAPGPAHAAPAPAISGLQVSGNRILNGAGQPVRLRGVQRLSGEYGCIFNFAIFEGPTGDTAIQAMLSWKINVVRLPLNEDCWLDVNTAGIDRQYVGAAYRAAVADYVTRLTAAGIVVILDLHWSAPGSQPATGQTPMPNRDHSVAFWASLADTFRSNTAVIFDLFNEPYPDDNRDTGAAWSCLRDGTTGPGSCPGVGYAAAGMQELLNAVRATGATNLVLVPGVAYTGVLSRWIEFRPTDPLGPANLAASVHIYPPYSQCSTVACWDQHLAPLVAQYPLVAGEVGQNTCAHDRIDPVLDWLESKQQHYAVHAWWTEPCGAAAYYGLITDYLTGAPSVGYGQGYKDRLATLVPEPVGTATATATLVATATPTRTPSATSTPTPSRTPTVTPRATPTSAVTPTSAPAYVVSAGVAPAAARPGGSVGIAANVTSASAATLVVDVEVHDADEGVVFQAYAENVAFAAGQTRTFPATWPIPPTAPPGRYSVQVGVFSRDWAQLLLWESYAAFVTVETAGPGTSTLTPTVTPTLTPTPTVTPVSSPTRTPMPPPSATPTSTLAPITCTPRPRLRVSTQVVGSGLLAATVAVDPRPGGGPNLLEAVTFGTPHNATVLLDGVPVEAAATVPLGGVERLTFVVRRADAERAATVPLTVRDRCGDWQTFVGGGAGAF